MHDRGQWRAGDRGQAVTLGVVLLIALSGVAIAVYNAEQVPAQNERVEADHARAVAQDLAQMHRAVDEAGATGGERVATVAVGVSYPNRVVGINPPPAAGQLRTGPPATVEVANAVATGPGVGDYWNGTTHTYETRFVTYRPDYARYQNAPTIRSGWMLLREYGAGTPGGTTEVVDVNQDVVAGRTITLDTVVGGANASRPGTATVAARGVSPATETVAVTGDGGPVVLRLPTRASESTWRDALRGERVANGGHVAAITHTTRAGRPDLVTIELEGDVTYDLRMSRTRLASGGTVVRGGPEDREVAYLAVVDGGGGSVVAGQNYTFGVQARDRYNNPVSGVNVTGNLSGPGDLTLTRNRTGPEGRVRAVYEAPDDPDGTENVTITLKKNGTDATVERYVVNESVGVTTGGGNGTGGTFNLSLRAAGPGRALSCTDVDTCTLNTTELALSGASAAHFTANISEPLGGKIADYAVNNSTVGTLEETRDGDGDGRRYADATESDGVADAYFYPGENGVVELGAASANSEDSMTLRVVSGGTVAPAFTSTTVSERYVLDTGGIGRPPGEEDFRFTAAYEVSDPGGRLDRVRVYVNDTSGTTFDGYTSTATSDSEVAHYCGRREGFCPGYDRFTINYVAYNESGAAVDNVRYTVRYGSERVDEDSQTQDTQ